MRRKSLLSWVVSFVLVCNSFVPVSLAAQHDAERLAVVDRLENATRLVESLADSVAPLDDLDALIERLDFEAEHLIDFVQTSVRFEPYAGTLKGAAGTFSSRAGNALDQSLLLAHLLKQAGFDARIVRAQLPSADALRLMQAALGVETESPFPADLPAFNQALEELAALIDASALPLPSATNRVGQPHPTATAVAVKLADITSMMDSADEVHAALADYFWVEWRNSPSEGWRAVHPAFGVDATPDVSSPTAFYANEIPKELQHRVRFEMGIERVERGVLSTELISAPWERPAANFFDAVVTLGVMPVDVSETGEVPSIYVPVFNGQVAPGGVAFNLRGQIVDLEAATNAAAGLFDTIGGSFLEAAEALGERPDAEPLMALTGHFVRVSWIRPDGRIRSEERWPLDRIPDRREGSTPRIDVDMDAQAVSDALSYVRTYLVHPPGEHTAWTSRRSLDAVLSRLNWSRAVLALTDGEMDELIAGRAQLPAFREEQPALLTLASMTHQPLSLPEGHLTWRDGPFVAALHQPLLLGTDAEGWIDVQFNPWRAVRIGDGGIEDWAEGSILRGVLDTGWESATLGSKHGYLDTGVEGLAILEIPVNAAQQRDIQQGFVLAVIPSGGDDEPRWWRLHPETGEVLGMRTSGGAVKAEYVLGLIAIAVTFFLIGKTVAECQNIQDSEKRSCCLKVTAAATALALPGIGLGAFAAPLALSLGGALLLATMQIKAAVVLDIGQGMGRNALCGIS
jgi:hypothetical protein